MTSMRHLPLMMTALCCSAFFGCTPPEAGTSHEVKRARSGGEYQFISFTGVQAELMHPSADPSGSQYYLCLPLPERLKSYDNDLPLARMDVRNGTLHFQEVGSAGESSTEGDVHLYHYVVKEGKALTSSNPKLEFRIVLLRMGSGEWRLALSKKQYSLRQLGEDLSELGAREAFDMPLTERTGWYRYAEVPFELRKGKTVADDLLIFSAKKP